MIMRQRTKSRVAVGGAMALVLAGTALTGTASAVERPTASTQGIAGTVVVPNLPPPAVCAANAGRPNGEGITAQDFEAGFDAYDTWGAADFMVTTKCQVSTVSIPGIPTGDGPANAITISFHQGSPANEALCLTTQAGPGPNFTVNVRGCTLKKGRNYWLVVQVDQNVDPGHQWFWATTNHRVGANDQWQNPGDGFSTGCTSWDTLDNCVGHSWDFLFAVNS